VSSRDSLTLHPTEWLHKCHQRHKSLFFNPVELIKSGLDSFSVAIQKPGDLILTDIEGAHQGYNIGNNLAIAVNWATTEWLYHCLAQHINPLTHNITYACDCHRMQVGIPLDIWASPTSSIHPFKHLYRLGEKQASKLRAKEFSTAETTWCFYIFLAVEYLDHIGHRFQWLESKKWRGGSGNVMMTD